MPKDAFNNTVVIHLDIPRFIWKAYLSVKGLFRKKGKRPHIPMAEIEKITDECWGRGITDTYFTSNLLLTHLLSKKHDS